MFGKNILLIKLVVCQYNSCYLYIMYYVFLIILFLGYRKPEVLNLKKRKYLDALCVYFWATTPVTISILTFSTYIFFGGQLTATKVSIYFKFYIQLHNF